MFHFWFSFYLWQKRCALHPAQTILFVSVLLKKSHNYLLQALPMRILTEAISLTDFQFHLANQQALWLEYSHLNCVKSSRFINNFILATGITLRHWLQNIYYRLEARLLVRNILIGPVHGWYRHRRAFRYHSILLPQVSVNMPQNCAGEHWKFKAKTWGKGTFFLSMPIPNHTAGPIKSFYLCLSQSYSWSNKKYHP